MSQYRSPLIGFENAEPLPTTANPDGKSLYNPPALATSKSYDTFPEPIDSSNNGFDFHIYFMQAVPSQVEYAHKLQERIRREFPELRVYKVFERPVGPHTTGMFEVNVFNPHQVGALFSFLTVWRGPLSVLIHPNTNDAHKDHTELMTWMGKPLPLNDNVLKR